MIDDDIEIGDADFLQIFWEDTSVIARVLKCLIALWSLGCIYAIALNFI